MSDNTGYQIAALVVALAVSFAAIAGVLVWSETLPKPASCACNCGCFKTGKCDCGKSCCSEKP